MPKKLIHYIFISFLLTAITGIWMRLFVFTDKVHFIDYSNMLHAHSHMAILGWTFLAVFIIFLSLAWESITNKKHAIILTTTIFFVTFALFIAFLYQGYATYSIILSTTHIFVEYWTIIFIVMNMKNNQMIPKITKLFLTGGVITLFISSFGPFGLGGLAASGLRDSPFFEMAIYFYLHFQYNGWLYLMLVGLFLYILTKKGFKLPTRLLTQSFWIYFIALFPGFFLSVLWYDFGLIGLLLGVIGALGQLIGVSLFCFVIWQQRFQFHKTFSKFINFTISLTICFLIIKVVMELGLLFPALATMVYDTRAVVIGYLHLTLLGFISLFILVIFQMLKIIDSKKTIVKYGIVIFLVGFFLNEVILFLSGLLSWLHINEFIFSNGLLLTASILLFLGILLIWLSVTKKTTLKK